MFSYEISKSEKIKALANEKRRRIIYLLLENKEMTYFQLLREISIKPAALTYHLRELEKANIIENFYKKVDFPKKGYSFYKLTEDGLSFVKLLIEKGYY